MSNLTKQSKGTRTRNVFHSILISRSKLTQCNDHLIFLAQLPSLDRGWRNFNPRLAKLISSLPQVDRIYKFLVDHTSQFLIRTLRWVILWLLILKMYCKTTLRTILRMEVRVEHLIETMILEGQVCRLQAALIPIFSSSLKFTKVRLILCTNKVCLYRMVE